jgi:hypothetical protein
MLRKLLEALEVSRSALRLQRQQHQVSGRWRKHVCAGSTTATPGYAIVPSSVSYLCL